jgi:diguanylate cyclase (GGDEF)-like protein
MSIDTNLVAAPQLKELSVLFVDDEEPVRIHLDRILSNIFKNVYSAENGQSALDLFKIHKPDIVLTDITMPVMSGLELAKQLKQSNPKVPVIAISAFNDVDYLQDAINLGVDGYLTKPLNVNVLFRTLQKHGSSLMAERLAKQQTRLLSGVNMAIQYLLSAHGSQDAVDFALQELAKAAQVAMVGLFTYETSHAGKRSVRLMNGCAGDHAVAQVVSGENPVIPQFHYVERWYHALSQGKSICGSVSTFPDDERAILTALGGKSLLVAPVFEDGILWGFVTLVDLANERNWSEGEMLLIMTAARGLGSFISRLKFEEERVKSRAAMELANRQWQETFNTIPDMITVLSRDHKIVHINKAARDRLMIPEHTEGNIGHCFMHYHETPAPPDGCPHSTMLEDGQPHETEVFIPKINSYLHITVNPIFDASGEISGSVHVARDITRRREVEERLRYLSTHDEMTRLFNRAYFEAEVERLKGGRTAPISVVVVDLDDLKSTNDNYGHDYGDAMIRAAAELLREVFRGGDTIARIGGDEFAILMQGVGEEVLATVMTRARARLSNGDFKSEHGLTVRFSIGAATVYNPSKLPDAIRDADMAMYEDKKERKVIKS